MYQGRSLRFLRCAYHAKVMNTFDRMSSTAVRRMIDMMVIRVGPLHSWIELAAVLGACRSTTEPVRTAPYIRFVEGANAADTVREFLPHATLHKIHESPGASTPLGP